MGSAATVKAIRELLANWSLWARDKQLPPPGTDWTTWAITSGRGFGKTRTGSEWVRAEVAAGRATHVAMVERTPAHAREGMVEGRSGILSVSLPHEKPLYIAQRRRLEWPNGAVGHVYTAAQPDDLRGPEHDLAWCEEVASWSYGPEAWSNLQLGMRVGPHPRTLITTTPKPVAWLQHELKREGVIHVTGSTYENKANLSKPFLEQILDQFRGTHLEQQEILGHFLGEMPGALWNRGLLESTRAPEAPELERITVGVDPATTSGDRSDETGIVAAGCAMLGGDRHGFVLADRSGRHSPEGWAREALRLARDLGADRIVAESNQGGEMVRHTILGVRPKAGDGLDGRSTRVLLVHASTGKRVRAEPVVGLFEQNRAHMVGNHIELEDQLCGWEPLESQASPDRLDAMVYALRDLLVTAGITWSDLYGDDDDTVPGASVSAAIN